MSQPKRGTRLPAPLLPLLALVVLASCIWLSLSLPRVPGPPFPRRHVPQPPRDWFGWQLKERDDRFNAWLAYIQFHMLPAFTPQGFEVAQAPVELHQKLRELLLQYQDQTPEDDPPVNVVGAAGQDATPPGFVNTGALNNRSLDELKPMLEQWANVTLEPQAAYGLRVYRRGNGLIRHVDRVETHIISAILHVDRDIEEPWPLVIEDHEGREHSVNLLPGQVLFYESAKQPHARPSLLKGRFYSSLFLHFRPVGWDLTHDEVIEYLPDDWARDTVDSRGEDEDGARRGPLTFGQRLEVANQLRDSLAAQDGSGSARKTSDEL